MMTPGAGGRQQNALCRRIDGWVSRASDAGAASYGVIDEISEFGNLRARRERRRFSRSLEYLCIAIVDQRIGLCQPFKRRDIREPDDRTVDFDAIGPQRVEGAGEIFRCHAEEGRQCALVMR